MAGNIIDQINGIGRGITGSSFTSGPSYNLHNFAGLNQSANVGGMGITPADAGDVQELSMIVDRLEQKIRYLETMNNFQQKNASILSRQSQIKSKMSQLANFNPGMGGGMHATGMNPAAPQSFMNPYMMNMMRPGILPQYEKMDMQYRVEPRFRVAARPSIRAMVPYQTQSLFQGIPISQQASQMNFFQAQRYVTGGYGMGGAMFGRQPLLTNVAQREYQMAAVPEQAFMRGVGGAYSNAMTFGRMFGGFSNAFSRNPALSNADRFTARGGLASSLAATAFGGVADNMLSGMGFGWLVSSMHAGGKSPGAMAIAQGGHALTNFNKGGAGAWIYNKASNSPAFKKVVDFAGKYTSGRVGRFTADYIARPLSFAASGLDTAADYISSPVLGTTVDKMVGRIQPRVAESMGKFLGRVKPSSYLSKLQGKVSNPYMNYTMGEMGKYADKAFSGGSKIASDLMGGTIGNLLTNIAVNAAYSGGENIGSWVAGKTGISATAERMGFGRGAGSWLGGTLGGTAVATAFGGPIGAAGYLAMRGVRGAATFAKDSVVQNIKRGEEFRQLTQGIVTSGAAMDIRTGSGLNMMESRRLGRGVAQMAAEDVLFDEDSYKEMLRLGKKFDMVRGLKDASQIQGALKKIRDRVKTTMEILGSDDLEETMELLGKYNYLGIKDKNIANRSIRSRQVFARMASMSKEQERASFNEGVVTGKQYGWNVEKSGLIFTQSKAASVAFEQMYNQGLITQQQFQDMGGGRGFQDKLSQSAFEVMQGIATSQDANANVIRLAMLKTNAQGNLEADDDVIRRISEGSISFDELLLKSQSRSTATIKAAQSLDPKVFSRIITNAAGFDRNKGAFFGAKVGGLLSQVGAFKGLNMSKIFNMMGIGISGDTAEMFRFLTPENLQNIEGVFGANMTTGVSSQQLRELKNRKYNLLNENSTIARSRRAVASRIQGMRNMIGSTWDEATIQARNTWEDVKGTSVMRWVNRQWGATFGADAVYRFTEQRGKYVRTPKIEDHQSKMDSLLKVLQNQSDTYASQITKIQTKMGDSFSALQKVIQGKTEDIAKAIKSSDLETFTNELVNSMTSNFDAFLKSVGNIPQSAQDALRELVNKFDAGEISKDELKKAIGVMMGKVTGSIVKEVTSGANEALKGMTPQGIKKSISVYNAIQAGKVDERMGGLITSKGTMDAAGRLAYYSRLEDLGFSQDDISAIKSAGGADLIKSEAARRRLVSKTMGDVVPSLTKISKSRSERTMFEQLTGIKSTLFTGEDIFRDIDAGDMSKENMDKVISRVKASKMKRLKDIAAYVIDNKAELISEAPSKERFTKGTVPKMELIAQYIDKYDDLKARSKTLTGREKLAYNVISRTLKSGLAFSDEDKQKATQWAAAIQANKSTISNKLTGETGIALSGSEMTDIFQMTLTEGYKGTGAWIQDAIDSTLGRTDFSKLSQDKRTVYTDIQAMFQKGQQASTAAGKQNLADIQAGLHSGDIKFEELTTLISSAEGKTDAEIDALVKSKGVKNAATVGAFLKNRKAVSAMKGTTGFSHMTKSADEAIKASGMESFMGVLKTKEGALSKSGFTPYEDSAKYGKLIQSLQGAKSASEYNKLLKTALQEHGMSESFLGSVGGKGLMGQIGAKGKDFDAAKSLQAMLEASRTMGDQAGGVTQAYSSDMMKEVLKNVDMGAMIGQSMNMAIEMHRKAIDTPMANTFEVLKNESSEMISRVGKQVRKDVSAMLKEPMSEFIQQVKNAGSDIQKAREDIKRKRNGLK